MKLKVSQILNMHAALGLLGGRDKIVHTNNEDRIVRVPYSIKGDVQLAIVVNLNRLQPFVDAHNKLQRQMIVDLSEGKGSIENGTPAAIKVGELNQQMLDAEHPVKLCKIKLVDLKLDENPIEPSVIAAITSILEFTAPADVVDEE